MLLVRQRGSRPGRVRSREEKSGEHQPHSQTVVGAIRFRNNLKPLYRKATVLELLVRVEGLREQGEGLSTVSRVIR